VSMVTGSYDEKRRAELAAFLRARRERITPAEVGLAPGSRRRTPGLRREEVAQLAGVGVTWYTWLEQGRPINASTQVLDAVARVLRLGAAERWHLYRLADVPGVPTPTGDDVCLPDVVPAVLDAIDPNPACVYSGKYDLLACNHSYAALFPFLTRADGHERNALWQLFTHSPDDGPMCDWTLIPHMVAVARGNYARHVGDPEWEQWIARLSSVSAEFVELWGKHEVSLPMPAIKMFRAMDLGTVNMRTSSFGVAGMPDGRMVVYLPETAADQAKVELLKARVDVPRQSRPA
jgi:transcriptional regulator with XRE-family HTH domain